MIMYLKTEFCNSNKKTILYLLSNLSDVAPGYGLDGWGFESRQGLGIFLSTTASRPTLGPTQPSIHWVPGALSLGIKRPGYEADHSPPSNGEVKNALSCSWRGSQL
jgi:hypothetical protein